MKSNRLFLESRSSRRESERIQYKTPLNIVKEYIGYPELPINKEMYVYKMGVYNWNPNERISLEGIYYHELTSIDSAKFPEENQCYLPNDFISPVIIIDTDGIKYRTDYKHWRVLIDISDGIILKQSLTNRQNRPLKIFVDGENKWISQLFYLVGHDVINKLKPPLLKPTSWIGKRLFKPRIRIYLS